MNLVTLTMHSPSHASARFDARVTERNRRTTDSMEVGEVRGKGNGNMEREGEPFSLSS